MALIKCTECGAEISDLATTCPKCGAPLTENVEPIDSMEEVDESLDMTWIGYVIPPVGFILYFIRKESNPQKAKSILIASFIGLAIDISIFCFI